MLICVFIKQTNFGEFILLRLRYLFFIFHQHLTEFKVTMHILHIFRAEATFQYLHEEMKRTWPNGTHSWTSQMSIYQMFTKGVRLLALHIEYQQIGNAKIQNEMSNRSPMNSRAKQIGKSPVWQFLFNGMMHKSSFTIQGI